MQGHAGHHLMLTSLAAYFEKNMAQRKLLRDMVDGGSPVSLRLMDWFVTHYARHRAVVFWIDDEAKSLVETFPAGRREAMHLRKFNCYLEYRAQLKSYSKHVFDPFRRHERLTFVVQQQPLQVIETTVGQLNFFRWVFQNHIFDYIQRHVADIEDSMTRYAHERRSAAPAAAPPSAARTGHLVKCSSPKQPIGVAHGGCRVSFE
jgi:hypothetical protein